MLLLTLALLTAPPDSAVVRDVEVAPGETLRTTSVGHGEPLVLVPGVFGAAFGGGPAESASTPGMRKAFRFGGLAAKFAMDEPKLRHDVRREIVRNSGDTAWLTDAVIRAYTAGQTADLPGSIDAFRQMAKSKERESLADRLHQIKARYASLSARSDTRRRYHTISVSSCARRWMTSARTASSAPGSISTRSNRRWSSRA